MLIRILLCCCLLLSQMAVAQEGGWLTSYDEAVKLAKKTNRPILMDFTGSDWCGWCVKLKKEVFDTPEFQKWANTHVVLLEVDFPKTKPQTDEVKKQNAGLNDKYDVKGFPTIIFADASGKVLGEYGYDEGGPANWIKKAEGMLKKK